MRRFFLLLSIPILISCNEIESTKSCKEIGEDGIEFLKDHKDEIVDILKKSMAEENEKINMNSAKDVLAALKEWNLYSEFNEYETVLEKRCPEEYNNFNETLIGLLILEMGRE